MVDLAKKMINGDAVINGEWVGDIPGFGSAQILTASIDSPAAQKYRQQLIDSIFGNDNPRDVLDDVHFEEFELYINAMALADICIKDWKGITDGAQTIAWSPQYLKQLLMKQQPLDAAYPTPNRQIIKFDARDLVRTLIGVSQRAGRQRRDRDSAEKKPLFDSFDTGSDSGLSQPMKETVEMESTDASEQAGPVITDTGEVTVN